MYARLVRSRTTKQKCAETHRSVRDDVIPALREEPGFVGALNLVDPNSGDALMIELWQSAEQARQPDEHGLTSVWEVVVRV